MNFDKENLISAVITFGDGKGSYVKKYSMQFGDDGKTWIDYEQQGVKRVRTRLQNRKKSLTFKHCSTQRKL